MVDEASDLTQQDGNERKHSVNAHTAPESLDTNPTDDVEDWHKGGTEVGRESMENYDDLRTDNKLSTRTKCSMVPIEHDGKIRMAKMCYQSLDGDTLQSLDGDTVQLSDT